MKKPSVDREIDFSKVLPSGQEIRKQSQMPKTKPLKPDFLNLLPFELRLFFLEQKFFTPAMMMMMMMMMMT